MARYEPVSTFLPENKFSFTCPIFNVSTEIRSCLHLRDLLWAGRRQVVRKGCQACLSDSKCPVYWIVREATHTGADPGYYAREPRLGQLKPHILERIENIVVMDATMKRFEVTDSERAAIEAANGRAGQRSPAEQVAKPRKRAVVLDDVKSTEASAALIEAAKTGDMSAAISTDKAA